jgi:hypothetical protein
MPAVCTKTDFLIEGQQAKGPTNGSAGRDSDHRRWTSRVVHQLFSDATRPRACDPGTQVARAWRDARWDSFTLVIPNWSVRLAGFPYSGNNPDGFMSRSEIVSHLEQYAASFGAPLSYGVHVTAVDPAPDGNGFQVSTANGADYVATNVVVATGSFQFPKSTPLSAALPPHIFQLHSSHYLPGREPLSVGRSEGQSGGPAQVISPGGLLADGR